MSVAENLAQVQERIRKAELSAGRDAGSVRLLAVSKLQPASAIREAYAQGQRDFGENYVQELCEKAAELADLRELRWHLIGHLQRNKARKVAPLASAVHSVDSIELADELAKRVEGSAAERRAHLGDQGARLDVLVEVSIAGEAQKSGAATSDVAAVCDAVMRHTSLRLRGLMCVPPATERPEDARPYFDALVSLRDGLGGAQRLPELSMGMTADLEPAIAAGATWVRVGTAIFGQRAARG